MTRMANPTAMEDKMASADLSPGERKLKAKRRRWWIIIAMLALAGFIPGFLLGYSEGEGLVDPQGVWPAACCSTARWTSSSGTFTARRRRWPAGCW
jgi:hypothetical protein